MFNPEEELIKELMRLTGQNRDNIQEVLDTVKTKMLGNLGISHPGKQSSPAQEGDFVEKEFDEENYPAYLPADNVKKYTLRFTLKEIRPSIWRKVEVPSNISLRHLAELIIEVMGWAGYHLNHFRVGLDTFYEPYYQRDGDMEFSFSSSRHYNQEEHTIEEILDEKGKHVIFEYDFGDGWEHEIRLSSIGEYAPNEHRDIRFIGGKRACPPEDCGSYWGYDELCEIHEKKTARKRLTKDERERLEWYANTDDGKDYDPEYMDIDSCIEAVDMLNDYSQGNIS